MVQKKSGLWSTFKRVCCDWGLTRPTKKPGEEFVGAPAPLWDNPAKKWFIGGAIFALVILLTMVGVMVMSVSFDIACELEFVNILKDIDVLVLIFDVIMLFRIATFERSDDHHWSRNIIISLCTTFVYLVTGTLLILVYGGVGYDPESSPWIPGCQSIATQSKDIALPIAILVLIYAVSKIAITIKLIIALYMKTALYLSRNKDEGTALP